MDAFFGIAQLALLIYLTHRSARIMATLKDVQDEIASLKDHVATEAGQVAAAVKDLTDQVTALRAQLDAGGSVTPADLDSVLASLKEVETSVDNITPPGAAGETPAIPTA